MTLSAFFLLIVFFPLLQFSPVPGLNGFLPIGIFVAMAILSLRLVGISPARKNIFTSRLRRLDLLIVALWLAVIPPVLHSVEVRPSMKVLFEWTLAVAVYFYIARVASEREIKIIVRSLFILVAASAVIVFFQRIFDTTWPVTNYLNDDLSEERLNFNDAGAVRSVGIFLHANSQAAFYSVVLPFCFGVIALIRKRFFRAIAISIALLGVFAQFLTLSRAGLLCVAVSIVSMGILQLFFGPNKRKILRSTIRKAAFSLALMVVAVSVAAFSTNIVRGVSERFFSSHYAERDEGSLYARKVNSEAGINAALSNPGLGIGPGMSAKVYYQYGGWRGYGPHNMYLLLASEFGFPVLILFLLISFVFVSRALRNYRLLSDPYGIPCVGALIAFALAGMFESMVSGGVLCLFFVLLGIIGRDQVIGRA